MVFPLKRGFAFPSRDEDTTDLHLLRTASATTPFNVQEDNMMDIDALMDLLGEEVAHVARPEERKDVRTKAGPITTSCRIIQMAPKRRRTA